MRGDRGFTYVGVLIGIALIGLFLTAASEVWTKTAERQRRVELEWIGQQYVHAIGTYYEASPGLAKAYPKTIEDLLEDRRAPFIRRHLRQAYPNPLSGAVDWELLPAATGGFRGVRPRATPVGDGPPNPSQIEFNYEPMKGVP